MNPWVIAYFVVTGVLLFGMFGYLAYLTGLSNVLQKEWYAAIGERDRLQVLVDEAAVPDSVQPPPTPNAHPAVWDLVLADMAARDALGRERYKVRLQPHNGRDMLRDSYEEKLDDCAYMRAIIYERDGR